MVRILLVEDDPDVASVISELLEYSGHHVTVASNGRYGLEILVNEQPELVISDFMMPMMSGLELIEAIQDHGYKGAVILCSAVPEANFPPHRARYDFFLQKPYSIHTLLTAVEAIQERLGHSGQS
jgi:CheY-like chemotaxis protein